MREFDMLPPKKVRELPQVPLCYSSAWERAPRGGFCELLVDLGALVAVGEPLATVFDAVGRNETVMRSKHTGMVVGMQRMAVVNRGDALVHIAQLGKPPKAVLATKKLAVAKTPKPLKVKGDG
jgi:predicted deacylase